MKLLLTSTAHVSSSWLKPGRQTERRRTFIMPPQAPLYGAFWNSAIRPSVRLSVPWRSCLGYRHAGCLQLSHRRPLPDPSADGRRSAAIFAIDELPSAAGGDIVSPPPGRYLVDTGRSIDYFGSVCFNRLCCCAAFQRCSAAQQFCSRRPAAINCAISAVAFFSF